MKFRKIIAVSISSAVVFSSLDTVSAKVGDAIETTDSISAEVTADEIDTADEISAVLADDAEISDELADSEESTEDVAIELYDSEYTDVYAVDGGNIYFNSDSGEIVSADKTITQAVIPEKISGVSVEKIGEEAFADCVSLKSVNISKNVNTIDEKAFKNCTALETVTLNDNSSVEFNLSIENLAFSNCSSLTELKLPEKDYSIELGNRIIDGTPIETFTVTKNVIKGGSDYSGGKWYNGALAGAENLKEVVFQDGLETIPDYILASNSQESYVEKVTIPDSVTSIGEYAFYKCVSIEEIVLPDSLQSIDEYAFSGCEKLKTINIPKTVKSIEEYCFSDCSALETVTLNNNSKVEFNLSIGDLVFSNCSSLTELKLPEKDYSIKLGSRIIDGTPIETFTVTKNVIKGGNEYCDGNLYDGAFAGAENLKEVIFQDGLETIPDYILASNSQESYVEKVTIPDSVTSIGKYAFYKCISIEGIVLSDSLQSMDEYAFSGCEKLKTIDIPKSVKMIGENCFSNCTALEEVTLNNNRKVEFNLSIDNLAFSNCSSLTELNLPERDYSIELGSKIIAGTPIETFTVTKNVIKGGNDYCDGKLYNGALAGALNLKEVVFQDGLETIPDYMLASNSQKSYVEKITIPDSVVSIGEMAFYKCINITEIALTESLQSIGEEAFSGCEKLQTIDIPKSVESIGGSCFSDCTALEEVTLNNNSTEKFNLSIGNLAFSNCEVLTKLNLPEDDYSIELGSKIIAGTSVETFIVTKNVIKGGNDYCDGKLYNGALAGALNLKEVVFQDGLEKIPDYMLASNSQKSYVKKVIIPDSVTLIGEMAFYKCTSIKEIALPESLQSIGDEAFSGCEKIITLNIPKSVESIGNSCFSDCTALEEVTLNGNSAEKFNLLIGNSAFANCEELWEFELPEEDYSIELGSKIIAGTSVETFTVTKNVIKGGISYYDGWYNGALAGALNLKEVVFQDGLEKIPDYMLASGSQKSYVEKVTIPDSVKSIGNYAFYKCIKIKEITLPKSLQSIGEYAFANCTGIKTIIIPSSVTTIMSNAFSDCTNLEKVYCYHSTAADESKKYPSGVKITYIGNVNNDSTVDEADTALMLKDVNGTEDISSVEKNVRDYNMDGEVNILDIIDLLKDMKK